MFENQELEPKTVALETWKVVPGGKFDAYPKRQFVLAYHQICPTIKTLPATLPELSSMDLGPRTGVTVGVSLSALDFIEGGGA